MQDVLVVMRLKVRKWRHEAPARKRSNFAERLAGLASPHAHQSDAIADILVVMSCGAGGELITMSGPVQAKVLMVQWISTGVLTSYLDICSFAYRFGETGSAGAAVLIEFQFATGCE